MLSGFLVVIVVTVENPREPVVDGRSVHFGPPFPPGAH